MWDSKLNLLHRYNPNAPIRGWSTSGDTPLHCAARSGMQIVVSRLMEQGGNPFLKNQKDQTPLHLVCTSARNSSRTSKKRAAILEMLLSKVAPPASSPVETRDGSDSYLNVTDRVRHFLNSILLHLFFKTFLLLCQRFVAVEEHALTLGSCFWSPGLRGGRFVLQMAYNLMAMAGLHHLVKLGCVRS